MAQQREQDLTAARRYLIEAVGAYDLGRFDQATAAASVANVYATLASPPLGTDQAMMRSVADGRRSPEPTRAGST